MRSFRTKAAKIQPLQLPLKLHYRGAHKAKPWLSSTMDRIFLSLALRTVKTLNTANSSDIFLCLTNSRTGSFLVNIFEMKVCLLLDGVARLSIV